MKFSAVTYRSRIAPQKPRKSPGTVIEQAGRQSPRAGRRAGAAVHRR